jgi:hypothetical protein
MEKFNFTKPDFLFCEIPVKDGSMHDDRVWVYCTKALSLIEFVNVDTFKDFEFNAFQKRYEYDSSDGILENYFGVFVQNNCEFTEKRPDKVMDDAWQFYKDYLQWEDKQIDN